MAQGTRVRWIRAAIAGLGVTVSTTVVGCTSWDKPKETKSTAQPKIGLPNTTTLPPGGGAAQVGRQPVAPFNGAGSNIQPTNFASGTGRPNTNTPNTGGAYPYGVTPTGGAGSINPPLSPSVQPAVGVGPVGSAAPFQPTGSTVGYNPTPAAPDLFPPLPPPAQSGGNEFANGIVTPPGLAPIAPPSSPPPSAAPVYPTKGF